MTTSGAWPACSPCGDTSAARRGGGGSWRRCAPRRSATWRSRCARRRPSLRSTITRAPPCHPVAATLTRAGRVALGRVRRARDAGGQGGPEPPREGDGGKAAHGAVAGGARGRRRTEAPERGGGEPRHTRWDGTALREERLRVVRPVRSAVRRQVSAEALRDTRLHDHVSPTPVRKLSQSSG